VFPRETLLIEIERWHRDPSCGARTRIALTKQEARSYTGYECARCERWQPDALAERDIPEWWEELKITSLDGVRELDGGGAAEPVEPGEVVRRMSEAWKSLGACDEEEEVEGGEESGNSF
jgi:hypothetical protein